MTGQRRADRLADEVGAWPVVASTPIYHDDWVVALRRDEIHAPDRPDETFSRIVVEDPGAVVVLAIDDDDRVAVLRQYRHPAERRMIQLPAGKLDQPGEDPLAAARRELAEEAGLAATSWTHLLTTYASPGITAETHTHFLARGLREVEHDFVRQHEEADMDLAWVPRTELLAAVLSGGAQDGPLAIALLAHHARQRSDIDSGRPS